MSRRYTPEELKRLVLRLRQRLGLEDVFRLDMRVVLEKMKELFPNFHYERVRDSELKDGEGWYDASQSLLRIPDKTFNALNHHVPRAAFTVAHEIAHWALAHEGERFRRPQKQAYEHATLNIRREEREAEQFAALFLAPDHLAESCGTVDEVQRKFGLSRRAAEIRKEELDADARRRKGEQRPLPAGVVDFLQRARAKGYKVTSLPDEPHRTSTIDPPKTQAFQSSRATQDANELCTNCGNITLTRTGLELVCATCGLKLAL